MVPTHTNATSSGTLFKGKFIDNKTKRLESCVDSKAN